MSRFSTHDFAWVLYAQAGLFMALLFHSLRANRKFFGRFPVMETRQTFLFVWHSRAFLWRDMPVILIPIGMILFAIGYPGLSFHHLAPVFAFGLAQSIYLVGKRVQAPAALLLASSGVGSTDLLARVNQALWPLRCVALLDSGKGHFLRLNTIDDNLRTRNPRVWKSIVHRLMDMSPIIILDARGEGAQLRQESFILLDPARAGKVLFVTEEDGGSPALEFHGIRPDEHALKCFKASEIVPYLRECKDDHAPWRFPPAPVKPGSEGLVLEDWDNLPSVFMVGLIDCFHSSVVIQQSLESGKQLLALQSPLADLERKDVELSIEFCWEFVHNPNLAMLIFSRNMRAYIRIDFLRAVRQDISEHSAQGLRPPLTFEQLNQPEPIWSSVSGFLSELADQARLKRLEVRYVRH